jgi:dihydrofolate reductase
MARSLQNGQYSLVGVDLDSLVTAVLDSLDDDAPALAVKEVLQQAMRDQGELADALGSTFNGRTNNVLHRSDIATITSGATFIGSLIRENLIDEYRLVIHPVVIGNGTRLFGALREPLRLDLVEARTFPSGTLIHVYRPREAAR